MNTLDPLKFPEPIPVRLRDKSSALLTRITRDAPPYNFIGLLSGSLAPQLWTTTGRWTDTGADHPLDITEIQLPDGRMIEFSNVKISTGGAA